MVALDNTDLLPPPRLRLHFSLVGFIAMACALFALITMAMHGFDENGLRQGADMAWRFASFVFFVALIAGPLGHLVPWTPMRMLGARQRHLLWGFCACVAVYLAAIVVPNTIRPLNLRHEGLTPGTMLFVVFGAALTAVVACSITRQAKALLGDAARRAILTMGIAYFWLAYTLTGLARISGPHRPDVYYGLVLSLMVVALLLRFADCAFSKWKSQRPETSAAARP